MTTKQSNLKMMGLTGVLGLMWAGLTKPIGAIIRRYSIARHGHEPQLFWFMSANTRGAIIDGTRKVGDAFIMMEECKPDPNADWEKIRADYNEVVVSLITTVQNAAEQDSWQNEVMFIPAVLTRVEAYLKADGLGDKQRKFITSRLKNFLPDRV